MRGIFIVVGTALLDQFHWLVYVFGAFLIYTGVRLAMRREEEVHPERNGLVRALRRVVPFTSRYHGERFLVREGARLVATPLLLVLLVVEGADLVFALDSIPAVLAITSDPFLVFTSNVFAILGLRSLYFLLAGALDHFHYLRHALALILGFVGVKMLVSGFVQIPIGISLGVIASLLLLAVAASLARPRPKEAQVPEEVER
jgi:tellurite resistance protein TerC